MRQGSDRLVLDYAGPPRPPRKVAGPGIPLLAAMSLAIVGSVVGVVFLFLACAYAAIRAVN